MRFPNNPSLGHACLIELHFEKVLWVLYITLVGRNITVTSVYQAAAVYLHQTTPPKVNIKPAEDGRQDPVDTAVTPSLFQHPGTPGYHFIIHRSLPLFEMEDEPSHEAQVKLLASTNDSAAHDKLPGEDLSPSEGSFFKSVQWYRPLPTTGE